MREKDKEALEEEDTPCRFEVRPTHGDLTNLGSIRYINEAIFTLSGELAYDMYMNGPPRPLDLFPYYFKSRVSFIRYSEDGVQNELLEIFTPEMLSDEVKEKIDYYINSEMERAFNDDNVEPRKFKVESLAGTPETDNIKNQRGLSTMNDEIKQLFYKYSEQLRGEGKLSDWPYNISCTIRII